MITGKEKRKSDVFFLCQKIHLFKKILLSWLNSEKKVHFWLKNLEFSIDFDWLIWAERSVVMAFTLWALLEAGLLVLNAICILHEKRFLAKGKNFATLPLYHFTSLLVHHYTSFNGWLFLTRQTQARQFLNSTWHKLEIFKIIVEENYKEDLHNLSYTQII